MVRILIPFALGIFSGGHSQILHLIVVWVLWIFLAVLVLFQIRSLARRTFLRSTGLMLLLFFCGRLIAIESNNRENILPKGIHARMLVRIISDPSKISGKYRFDAEVIALKIENQWRKFPVKLRVLMKTTKHEDVMAGEKLFIQGKPDYPPEAFLKGNFSARKMLKNRGIDFLFYTKTGDSFKVIENNFSLKATAISLRKKFIRRAQDNGLHGKALSVFGALIMGDRTDIDQELLRDYSGSGLIHILAVSGLHVGLVYGAAFFLLNLIFRKRFPWGKYFILLSVVWFYAIITGFSASVIRASAMTSFLALAIQFRMSVSPMNILASSAFLMLMLEPDILHDIGFQLSFAAVWGILLFSTAINQFKRFSNGLVRYVCISAGVSIAAQMAVAGLGLYHFGSFPVYFLLSNLVGIPFSTLITYLGLATGILADIPGLGRFLSFLTGEGINLLNEFAHFMSGLPYAVINNQFIDGGLLMLSFVIIFQISLLFRGMNGRKIIVLGLLILSAGIYALFCDIRNFYNREYLVFRAGKEIHLVEIQQNKACYRIYNREIIPNNPMYEAVRVSLAKCHHINRFEHVKYFDSKGFSGKEFLPDYKGFNQQADWKITPFKPKMD